MDWEERVLPSIGNEVVKAVVAQYNAEQLLTQREKVRRVAGCACEDAGKCCACAAVVAVRSAVRASASLRRALR